MRSILFLFALSLTLQAGTLAQFRTPLGVMDVELFDQDKPVTVQNFIRYVQSGAYTNMFFHRWAPGFVIQGGGFSVTNRGLPNAQYAFVPNFGNITNEFGIGPRYSNIYGTIAMAKQPNNPNSASSQWFFNLADNSANLDFQNGGFTVFGRIIAGTNILNRFNDTSTNNGIYLLNAGAPLDQLPVLSPNPTFENLVYVDISLLNVQVRLGVNNVREISWNSVSNRINRVEFTANFPPTWQLLVATNGNGAPVKISDAEPLSSNRFYRVRVDY
ncbi:MAG: peptidylprolyl isomerase [Verrucomicrobiota bacterium]|nr:peptidylprolyl isomerase [Verrucomicrobiota bacterium]